MSPSIDRARARRAAWASATLFFMLGFAAASWLSRLPAVRDALDLRPTDLGTLLLVGSFGSLLALPSAGPLVGRFGAAVIARAGAVLWAFGIVGVALSVQFVSRGALALCLVLVSCGMSLWGTTMNIEGGLVEAALRRVILAKLHAMYSIGTVVGALAGAGLVALGLPVIEHLLATAVLALTTVWISAGFFLSAEEISSFSAVSESGPSERTRGRTRRAWRERRTVLIAVMVLAAGLLEGSANDWLALAMVDDYQLTQAHASVVLSMFLAVMASVRLASDRLHRRWSASHLLRGLLILACAGLVLVAFSPYVWMALVGVVLWAMGAALVFPTGASALSTEPEMTAARVSVLSTINYGASLIGPPVLGLIAEHIGYAHTLAVLVLPVAVGVFLTSQVDRPVHPDEGGQARADVED